MQVFIDPLYQFFAAQINDFVGSEGGAKYAGSDVVPIPASVWLMGSALGMLGWMRKRSKAAGAEAVAA